jgi:hypothetical protein
MTIERDNIPELTIELVDDSNGSHILLEQNSGGNIDRVAIHRVQLRYMAEKFGLIEASDPQATKTIATLTRRLLVLRERIDHLGNYLAQHSDHDDANLDYELTYITATAEIADEFCADFDGTAEDAT